MATNPMQRKARNSFLLGMLVMLLVSGIIIAILFMQLMEKNKKEREQANESVKAFVLNQDVSSGQIITKDMLVLQTVNKTLVPSNATSDISVIENYSLQDKEGNEIGTLYDKNGDAFLYTIRGERQYLIEKEQQTNNYYLQKVSINNSANYIYIKKNNDGNIVQYIDINGEHEFKQDDEGNYMIDNRRQSSINVEKDYMELNNVPLIAKVAMKKNTLITTELISKGDDTVQNDKRKQEYNMIVLPMDLMTGDYVDIRFMLPSGQDFIVVSKKEVEIPNVSGIDSSDTMWINLSEDEILHMSCAIIEAYQIKGSKLYATKYTEAGMQDAAIPTYPVNGRTSELLDSDPNILDRAKQEIHDRYNKQYTHGDETVNSYTLRNNSINGIINRQGEESEANIEAGMTESATNSKNSRKEYLESLSGKTVQ